MAKQTSPKFTDHLKEGCPYGMCCRSEKAQEGIKEKFIGKRIDKVSALQRTFEEPQIIGGLTDRKIETHALKKVLVVNEHEKHKGTFFSEECPYGMTCDNHEHHVTYHHKLASVEPPKKSNTSETTKLKDEHDQSEACPYGMACMAESNVVCHHTIHDKAHSHKEYLLTDKTDKKASEIGIAASPGTGKALSSKTGKASTSETGKEFSLKKSLENLGSYLTSPAKHLFGEKQRDSSGTKRIQCKLIREECPYGMHCCENESIVYHHDNPSNIIGDKKNSKDNAVKLLEDAAKSDTKIKEVARVKTSSEKVNANKSENIITKKSSEKISKKEETQCEESSSVLHPIESFTAAIVEETRHLYRKSEEFVNQTKNSLSNIVHDSKEKLKDYKKIDNECKCDHEHLRREEDSTKLKESSKHVDHTKLESSSAIDSSAKINKNASKDIQMKGFEKSLQKTPVKVENIPDEGDKTMTDKFKGTLKSIGSSLVRDTQSMYHKSEEFFNKALSSTAIEKKDIEEKCDNKPVVVDKDYDKVVPHDPKKHLRTVEKELTLIEEVKDFNDVDDIVPHHHTKHQQTVVKDFKTIDEVKNYVKVDDIVPPPSKKPQQAVEKEFKTIDGVKGYTSLNEIVPHGPKIHHQVVDEDCKTIGEEMADDIVPHDHTKHHKMEENAK